VTDAEKARKIFQEAGLILPSIPKELAERLKEQDNWLFSTREISMSPYNLQHYVCEVNVEDYVILSHSGHGVNSYAIQYYLVYKTLRMFLQLGWGGVYMDAKADATKIHKCFSLADEIIPTIVQNAGGILASDRLTIVGSDFYGSYWSQRAGNRRDGAEGAKDRALVLVEALHWLQGGTEQ
jgi:hypothetical protein